MASLTTEARKLLDRRIANEAAQKIAKETKDALDKQQGVVHDMMEAAGDVSVTKDLGPGYGRVQLGRRKTIFGRVIDSEIALESLEKEGYGPEMAKTEIRKGPLNELIRTRLETGEALPAGVDFSETRYVQVTRRKTKA